MTSYDNRPQTFLGANKPGPRRVNLGPVGQRLASVFRAADEPEPRPEGRRAARWSPDEREAVRDEIPPRFPLARNGYDQVAVDQHVADLDQHVAELERELNEVDRELAELRSHALSTDDVATEIRRIGEQTSEVLITAHEQRGEILRVAREEADRCVGEAQARARSIRVEGEARLRGLASENEAALGERDRLLQDLRGVSASLAAVVDAAEERIPSTTPDLSLDAERPTKRGALTEAENVPTDPDPPTDPGPFTAA
jgi:cell division septum initiation protein DivIVA